MYLMVATIFVPFIKVSDHSPSSKQYKPRTVDNIETLVKNRYCDYYDFSEVKIVVTPDHIAIDGLDHHIVHLVR